MTRQVTVNGSAVTEYKVSYHVCNADGTRMLCIARVEYLPANTDLSYVYRPEDPSARIATWYTTATGSTAVTKVTTADVDVYGRVPTPERYIAVNLSKGKILSVPGPVRAYRTIDDALAAEGPAYAAKVAAMTSSNAAKELADPTVGVAPLPVGSDGRRIPPAQAGTVLVANYNSLSEAAKAEIRDNTFDLRAFCTKDRMPRMTHAAWNHNAGRDQTLLPFFDLDRNGVPDAYILTYIYGTGYSASTGKFATALYGSAGRYVPAGTDVPSFDAAKLPWYPVPGATYAQATGSTYPSVKDTPGTVYVEVTLPTQDGGDSSESSGDGGSSPSGGDGGSSPSGGDGGSSTGPSA